MHASIMIFFVIIPLLVGTFGNYLIPLKIGAGDMAFPFLNGLAFWSALPAGSVMVTGFVLAGGAAAAGWTSYPPLSTIMQNNGVGNFATNFLRPTGSTWPMIGVWTNLVSFFLFIAYMCAYYVHVDESDDDRVRRRPISIGIGAALLAIGIIAFIIAWFGWADRIYLRLGGMTLINLSLWMVVLVTVPTGIGFLARGNNAGVGVLLSIVGAIISVRGVQHFAGRRRELGFRHVPLRRHRGDQHRARGCARSSERLVEVADRARPVGVLVPVALVAESLLDGHPSPVCVELVGGDQWQRGADTSAHLRSVSDDEDPAIGLDAEIDARMQRRGIGPGSPDWLLRPCGLGQDARRDHERARGEEASDEPASGYVFDGVHAVALPLFAAPLMAARMR